jgi:ATP-dependent Clp protease ATP-binding subunit ClpC
MIHFDILFMLTIFSTTFLGLGRRVAWGFLKIYSMEGALVQSAVVPTVYNSCAQVRGRARATAVPSMRTKTMTLGGFQGLRRANFLDTKSVVRRDFGSIVASQLARPRGKGSRMVVRAMFERFTEKAIKVIMLAQEEARRLGHNFVGTEQILLGLIGEGTGIAAKVLKSMGINLKDARVEVEKIIGRGSGFVAVEIPFTPRAKRVLELSLEEARQLGIDLL